MRKLSISLLLAFTVLSTGLFFSETHAEELTAKLDKIIGEVKVIRAGQQEEITAEAGMAINAGDIVKTGGESFVNIVFLPKTYIQLASESKLSIIRFTLEPQTSNLTAQVKVLSGHISKAIMDGLPKDAVFTIALVDYLPLVADAYHTMDQLPDITPSAYVPSETKRGKGLSESLPSVISNVSGIVEVIRVGDVEPIQASNGMKLNVGDMLKTGRSSYATVSFSPKTFVEVAESSHIKIVRNDINTKNSARDTRVDVLSGHLSEAITGDLPPDSKFEVVLVDYIPLEAEPYTAPESITPMDFTPASES